MSTNSQPEIYFIENYILDKPIIRDSIRDCKEKIKIEFAIQNSANGSYSIQAKLYEEQVIDFFSEIKESYVKQNLNFDKFFVCDFIFGKEQNLKITLKKNNKEIKLITTLGRIVSSKNSTVVYKYAGDELLIIKAKKKGKYEDLLDVKFQIILKENNLQQYYFSNNKYYYFITCNNEKVYKSSLISNDGTFDNIYIPTCILQPNFMVSFYNSENQLIISFNRNTDDIKSNQKFQLAIPLMNKVLYLEDKSQIIKNFSFVDYIKSGIKIALSIGIDFTGSNGHPLDKGTNHSIVEDDLNNYEKAILSCGNIVGFYDYDQLFPVFGFGAIIESSQNKNVSMCFNLNMSNNPDIKTIDNVLKQYRECLIKNKLSFAGPTYFSPLIRKVISRINKYDLFEYHILMILTDGIIEEEDFQPTIDAIVEASFLPLSIIIIGIGDEDFKKMEILDGDTVPLVSSSGIRWKRDIVQFVPFSNFKDDPKKLAMEVLAEIPRQIVEYYRFKNLNPIQIKELAIKNSKIINNNKSIKTSRDYDYNQGYSDRGDIYSQGDNISEDSNFNLSTKSNNNGSQTQRNYILKPNPFYYESKNSNINQNSNKNIKNKDNNTVNIISVNNFNQKDNVINIFNAGNVINNFNGCSNISIDNTNSIGSMIGDIDLNKLSLHETQYLNKK